MPLIADTDTLLQAARERTTAEHRCIADPDGADVTVCGRRNADRFRVPFVVHDVGDPRHRGVPDERRALLHRTTAIEDKSAFLVNTGHAGARVMVTFGGGAGSGQTTVRKPAP